MSDPTLEILKPEPRCGPMMKLEHDLLLFGCSAEKKNVCRFGLTPHRKQLMDTLCQQLSRWVDTLGKDFSPCENMLLLRGTSIAAEDRRDVIVILVDRRLRPKMQYFGRCTLDGACATDPFVLPEELPALVRYNVVASPLNGTTDALSCISSDDLCFELTGLDLGWQLFPLTWKWPAAAGDILLMEVTAVGDEIAETIV